MNTPFNLLWLEFNKNRSSRMSAASLGESILGSRAIDVHLKTQDTFRLDGDSRGIEIQALHGNLWITQTGDQADYLVTPGKHFTVTSPGAVIVQGLQLAKFRLIPTNC